jgi:hypothetical protein
MKVSGIKCLGLTLLPFAAKSPLSKSILGPHPKTNECASAETNEDLENLDKIFEREQNIFDQEEQMELMMSQRKNKL